MIMEICVKAGTGGYYDYDSCDLLLMRLYGEYPIPRIGETIQLLEDNDKKRTNDDGIILKTYHDYLVRDIVYSINDKNNDDKNKMCVTIYVIPIGRKITIGGD